MLVSSVKHLIIVNAISGADRSRALAERIPGDTETLRKIVLGCVHDIFSVWRNGRRAVGRALEVLRVYYHAVAEITGARHSTASSSDLRRVRRTEQGRIKV